MVMSLIIGYVDRMRQSSLSGGALPHSFFFFQSAMVFDLMLVDFDLSLPVGDKFFQSNDSGIGNWLSGSDMIFK